MRIYRVLLNGQIVESKKPGTYAGWVPGKIFGLLTCKSGMKVFRENRRFFLTLKDAIKEGYRPCKKCKPINEKDFEKIKHLVPEKTLEDFYNRDDK